MARLKLASLVVVVMAGGGCTAATWDAIGAAAAGASAGMSASNVSGAPGGKLMLFGGPGHQTYLGCLNCGEYATDSVFNAYGAHGSKYQTDSIFNSYSQFGSKYSSYSPCNTYATDPPVIVDGQGRFYGRLTVNTYNPQRTSSTAFLALVAAACQN